MKQEVLKAENVSVFYGSHQAVKNTNFVIENKKVTAMIGPSGCGKSSFLRCFNRMNDFIPDARVEGRIVFQGENIYHKNVDPVDVRAKIGMVFQKPNPFPKSIYDNIVWGPKMSGLKFDEDQLVEESLRKAALWDEVKDRLNSSAVTLSGGQQQRLCIARAIAMSPEVILMDEPCSALDPKSTQKIEQLIAELSKKYAIVIVTHNMQQASRVSDYTAFFYEGDLIEMGETSQVFTNPQKMKTEDYITGRFG